MPDVVAAAPALAMLVVAGFGAYVVAAVGMCFLTRATFAARAALLQSSVVALLLVSVVVFVPRVTAVPGAADPRPRRVAASFPERVGGGMPSAPPRAAVLPSEFVRLAVVAWVLGVLVRLMQLAGGERQLMGVRARARRSAHHPVLVSTEVDVPFVHGMRSPVIVVPDASECWTADTWRAVLLHESAHIARVDVPMKLIRELTLALHWFNPAVRRLIRRTDEACEGACDDVVLLHGSGRAQYAGTLVSFADAAWSYASVPSMAARTGLEHRVAAIMDRRRARRSVHPRDRRLPLVFGLLGGCALAFVVPRPAIALSRDVERARDRRPTPASATQSTTPPARPVPRDHIAASAARSVVAVRAGARRPIVNDTTEALLGLGQLLDDANPIVRQTAADALLAWGPTARAALEPVARTDDGMRSVRARRALATLGAQRD